MKGEGSGEYREKRGSGKGEERNGGEGKGVPPVPKLPLYHWSMPPII